MMHFISGKKAGMLLAILGLAGLYTGTVTAEGDGTTVNDYLQYFQANCPNTDQIVFVHYLGDSKADVSMYLRSGENFVMAFETDGYVGRNGIGKQVEGDGLTPIGIYDLEQPFGIKANPGAIMNYTQVTDTMYWCGDDCDTYNQLVDTSYVNHACCGEHLIDYSPSYNYAMFISYNKEGTYPDGSAIFLHCYSGNSSTGGCVAIPEEDMINVIQCVYSGAKICIF